jgi:hypothetical protein
VPRLGLIAASHVFRAVMARTAERSRPETCVALTGPSATRTSTTARYARRRDEVDVVLFDADLVTELEAITGARPAPVASGTTSEDLDAAARTARSPLRVLSGLVARLT